LIFDRLKFSVLTPFMKLWYFLFIASKIKCTDNSIKILDQSRRFHHFREKLKEHDILPETKEKKGNRNERAMLIYLKWGLPTYISLYIGYNILMALFNYIFTSHWFFWITKILIQVVLIFYLAMFWFSATLNKFLNFNSRNPNMRSEIKLK
jgi:hypothetical protein